MSRTLARITLIILWLASGIYPVSVGLRLKPFPYHDPVAGFALFVFSVAFGVGIIGMLISLINKAFGITLDPDQP